MFQSNNSSIKQRVGVFSYLGIERAIAVRGPPLLDSILVFAKAGPRCCKFKGFRPLTIGHIRAEYFNLLFHAAKLPKAGWVVQNFTGEQARLEGSGEGFSPVMADGP